MIQKILTDHSSIEVLPKSALRAVQDQWTAGNIQNGTKCVGQQNQSSYYCMPVRKRGERISFNASHDTQFIFLCRKICSGGGNIEKSNRRNQRSHA